jgi:formylglycine-generating enzyme
MYFYKLILYSTFILVTACNFNKNNKNKKINTINSEYIYINPGHYDLNNKNNLIDSKENRSVSITKGFWIKNSEITQMEWVNIMGENLSFFKNCGPSCPVENVSWYDAIVFLNKKSKIENFEECYDISDCEQKPTNICEVRTNEFLPCEYRWSCKKIHWRLNCNGYRLPTEAEWEIAALVEDSQTRFISSDQLKDIAIYCGNSDVLYKASDDCLDKQNNGPSHIKMKRPNSRGLYDTLGNVWEWTWDAYQENAPNGKDPVSSAQYHYKEDSRIIKGCGWNSSALECRVSHRTGMAPIFYFNWIGFRPVRSN